MTRWLADFEVAFPKRPFAFSATVVETTDDPAEVEEEVPTYLQEDLNQVRELALKEGFERGFADGKNEASRQWSEHFVEVIENAVRGLEQVRGDTRRWLAPLEAPFAELALQSAQRILKSEIDAGRYDIAEILREAIDFVGDQQGEIILRLHPDDHKTIEKDRTWPPGIRFVADPRIDKAAFDLETSRGKLEGDIDSRFEVLRAALNEKPEFDAHTVLRSGTKGSPPRFAKQAKPDEDEAKATEAKAADESSEKPGESKKPKPRERVHPRDMTPEERQARRRARREQSLKEQQGEESLEEKRARIRAERKAERQAARERARKQRESGEGEPPAAVTQEGPLSEEVEKG